MSTPLNLSSKEQTFLAEVISEVGAIVYRYQTSATKTPMNSPMEARLSDLFERFEYDPNPISGQLYDKLHRTGANS
jgi:hypothetical protein